MVWSGQRTGHRQRSQKSGDHSRRMAAIRFYLLSRRQFSAHTKSSLARTDKRTAGPQGTHAIATIKSALWTTKWLTIVFHWPAQIHFTITKPVKTRKTSNESYSYNLLNHINKMYTHDLFYLQQEWEAWLAPVYKQIRTTKSQLTHCTKY